MPIAGFTLPWSARGGEHVDLHLSTAEAILRVGSVRLDDAERSADDWCVTELGAAAAHRSIERGSYLVIDASDESIESISFEVMLTCERPSGPVLGAGPLRLDADGPLLIATIDGVPGGVVPIPARTWTRIVLEWTSGEALLRLRSLDALAPVESALRLPVPPLCGVPLLLGSADPGAGPTLDARFARPRVRTPSGTRAWNLPTLMPDGPVESVGEGAPGRLRAMNMPAFCVASPRWDGSCFDPRLRPEHYDAVHCHSDDVGALDWPATHRVAIPADADAGVHAFEIETVSGAVERIVFFVRASRAVAPLVFLVPTATYLAYADESLPEHAFPWIGSDRGHRFAQANGLLSLYDHHEDLSGVTLASLRRPRATVRDDYVYPLCGCPHGLPVDLRLLRFCRARGIAYDLVTDHDLHAEPDALNSYRVVMTGSHPEYLTVEMEQRLRNLVARGGSIAYLGGNGFAGTVAMRGELMELRRSPTEALRTCDGAVGEQHLSLTNEPGGHLRDRGRGEFSLVGVAISLMGFERGCPFTRTPASRDPDLAWLFDGVEHDDFGDDGVVLGAAAAYEVDATDPRLGTAVGTRVLARADGFSEAYVADPGRWHRGGDADRRERRCAEMTYRELPGGGIIFTASLVGWCGALPDEGATNDVGRITEHLLRHLVLLAAIAPAPARPVSSSRYPDLRESSK